MSEAVNNNNPTDINIYKNKNVTRHQIGSAEYDELFKKYDSDGDGKLNISNKNGINEIELLNKNYNEMIESGYQSEETGLLKKFFNKINDFLKNGDTTKIYEDGQEITSNGELDECVEQGDVGDCWLLSQLNALKNTDFGKKAIKEAIQKNNNGSYTVTLKGVNESYTFSSDEIQTLIDSGAYSKGDLDAKLLEMAIEKHYDAALKKEGKQQDGVRSIEGGNAGYDILEDVTYNIKFGSSEDKNIQHLFGIRTESFGVSKELNPKTYKNVIDVIAHNDLNKISIVLSSAYNLETGQLLDEGNKIPSHEYCLESVECDNDGNITKVYVTNPWQSCKRICLDIEDFNRMVGDINISAEDSDIKRQISEVKTQHENRKLNNQLSAFNDENSKWEDLIPFNVDIKKYIEQCGGFKKLSDVMINKFEKEYPEDKIIARRATYEALGLSYEDACTLVQHPGKMQELCEKYGYKFSP